MGSKVHTVDDSIQSDSDYSEISMVDLETAQQVNTVSLEGTFPKRIFAKVDVGGTRVKFQLDSGALCNVISLETLHDCLGHVKLEQTPQVLSMFNKTQIKPLGKCTLDLHNRKTDKSYQTEFVVIQEQCTPLIGSETIHGSLHGSHTGTV